MYAYILSALVATSLLITFFVYPLYAYFSDPKHLRRYPNFHPLSGITNIPFMIEAVRGFRSKVLREQHRKHPVIRTGPNALSYGTVQAIKDIYGHGSGCIKGELYEVLAGTHFHITDVVDKYEHQRKRKAVSAAYALKNMENWEFKVADKTERFIRACDKACTAPLKKDMIPNPEDLTFDYRAYTNFFSIDAIADIALSEHLHLLDRGNDVVPAERMDGTKFEVNFRNSLHEMARAQSIIVWASKWFKFNKWFTGLVSPEFRRRWQANDNWDALVYNRATERLKRYQDGEKLSDIFQALMEDRDGNPRDLEWGEIVAEVAILMNAGSDTTGIAMCNAMYWLLKNPECLARLRQEVDAVLDSDEIVAPYDKVKHLPYLRACLDETLRISPSTSFGLPRRTPAEGAYILGDFIPGDTTVAISAYVAHRDETVFKDPDQFIPDRWLGKNGKDLQPYFIAFSAGARGCIGRNISYLEQTVLLASVVHRYEFALPHPNWEQTWLEALNAMPGKMPLKVWRRDLKEQF
ncbi:Benzoate 4-monooxygenase [Fusarium oxysporum f. sp. cubense]|uniref:Benzoate 4-monooxygenase n=1 Tax=Fusarium oxysporum f. sp. cubense TaxID=61366 RepID=A0A559L1P6_FUSOC|nr:Benzoate 4-monooxygenase [Fusarium oxysporum f. sp. cubense]